MLITLHGIANCVKNETIRKMFLQTMTASCHDVAFNFFRAVLRILLSGLYLLEKLKLCVFSCATVSQLSRIQKQLSRVVLRKRSSENMQ